MANDSIRGRQVVLRLTNKSGGALVEGDVVIISSGTAAAITTTTTAGLSTDVIGVVLESIAIDAIGRVAIGGYVPKINLSASASLGDTFATHSVAKQAAPAASRSTGHFGEVLGTGATPAALLWGVPDGAASGTVATDTIWDAAGDLVQGTGANTAAKLTLGTAEKLLRVNAAANAVEWADAMLPWQVAWNPRYCQPLSSVGTWVAAYFNDISAQIYDGFGWYNSSGAQNDEVTWKWLMSAGTWTIDLHVRKATNGGIATVKIDGSSVGTLDTYASAVGAKLSIANVAVATTALHTFNIIAATKHASSSGYFLEFLGINLYRTA